MSDALKVVELFAGVGGFRLGLEGWQGMSSSSRYTEPQEKMFDVVWSNQWEPSTKRQHASLLYEYRWGHDNSHSNVDIAKVKVDEIPLHDVLVGGFPCQDYSVATILKNSKGIEGKKGVLWWEIYRILNSIPDKPNYLILENVDRLIKSPAKQRGRDFAIILRCLNDLGYIVEWKVINAAEYGMPQRRRRVFILAYLNDSPIAKQILKNEEIEISDMLLLKGFPINEELAIPHTNKLNEDLQIVSDDFGKDKKDVFLDTGISFKGEYKTIKSTSAYQGPFKVLDDIILTNGSVPSEYKIDEDELVKWEYLKGSKSETRVSPDGYKYKYSEGGMTFPDPLDKPSRTIITGEGGKAPSRFKHVIFQDDRYRRLTPLELERLNMFPDNHTYMEAMPDAKRAFLMGNALVVGIVEIIGKLIWRYHNGEDMV